MKKIKNSLAVLAVLIGLFAFQKAEKNSTILPVEKEKVVEMTVQYEFGCRPKTLK